MGESELAGFALLHHVAYLDAMASEVPHDCATQEVNHLTLVHFAVAGLSLLRGLNRVNKEQIINWVLSFQIHPESNNDLDNGQFYGFCGSRTTQFPANNVKARVVSYDVANIDSKALLSSMKKLQQPDGSFMPTHIGAETDLRLVYCAAAICSMLKDWTGMDAFEPRNTFSIASHMMVALAWFLVQNLMPGGGTFCAVAALYLMSFIQVDLASNLLESASIDEHLLLEWCLQSQATDGGFQGRRNKPNDTCYAFWVGGVLKIIGAYHLIDHSALRNFLLTC